MFGHLSVLPWCPYLASPFERFAKSCVGMKNGVNPDQTTAAGPRSFIRQYGGCFVHATPT